MSKYGCKPCSMVSDGNNVLLNMGGDHAVTLMDCQISNYSVELSYPEIDCATYGGYHTPTIVQGVGEMSITLKLVAKSLEQGLAY